MRIGKERKSPGKTDVPKLYAYNECEHSVIGSMGQSEASLVSLPPHTTAYKVAMEKDFNGLHLNSNFVKRASLIILTHSITIFIT